MTRVVPDTNIIISAVFWSGKPYKIISRGLAGEYQLVTSPEIVDEVISKLRKKFQFPEDKVDEQANIMEALETKIMRGLGFPNPYAAGEKINHYD